MDKSGKYEALPPYQPDSQARRRVDEDGPRPRRRVGIFHALGLLILLTTVFSLLLKAPLRTFALIASPTKDARLCMDQLAYSSRIAEAIAFGPSQSLTIREKIDTNRTHHGHGSRHMTRVFGSIVLVPEDDASSPASGRIELDIASNVEDPRVEVRFDPDTQAFTVLTDLWGDDDSGSDGSRCVCIQMHIAAYVPKHAELDTILVEADHLGITIADGLDVRVARGAALATVVGGVAAGTAGQQHSYTLGAPDVRVHTVDGGVRGWFALRDALTIKTVSGSVDVDVTPVALADGEQPGRPAALHVSSVSGRIGVREALGGDELPLDRHYAAQVASTSGGIAARLAFADATLESVSGDIDAELLPVPVPVPEDEQEGSAQLRLSTSSKSGRSRVRVLAPRGGEDGPAMTLLSRHASLSGRIEAAYPAAWEGGFAMKSVSGKLAVRGDGVRWTGGGRFLPRVTGSKGSGPSRLEMESISGNQDLTIGQ